MTNQADIKQHMINPFTVDSSNMLTIAIGQAATAPIKKVLETVEQIGQTELQKCLNDNSKKIQEVKLDIFKELHSRQQQSCPTEAKVPADH